MQLAIPIGTAPGPPDAIGESTTFFVFSAFCVITYVFVWRYVPETKGHSLEEIQERWVGRGDRMLEANG